MSTTACFLRPPKQNRLLGVLFFLHYPHLNVWPLQQCMNLENPIPLSKSQLSHRIQTLPGTVPVIAMLPLPTFHNSSPLQSVPGFSCGREILCFLSLSWILLLVTPVSLTQQFSFPCHSSLVNEQNAPGKWTSETYWRLFTWWQLLELQAWNENKYLITNEIGMSGKYLINPTLFLSR